MTRPNPGYAAQQMADEAGTAAAQDAPGGEYPPFVTNDADRTRWDNAGKVATDLLGDDATPEAVWYMRRELFHNREQYSD